MVVLISLPGRLRWTFCRTAEKQRVQLFICLKRKFCLLKNKAHVPSWHVDLQLPNEASAEGEIGLHPAGKLRFAEWQISRMMHLWDEID